MCGADVRASIVSTETEIKLTLPPKALRRVQHIAWLRKLASGDGRSSRVISVYFDTTKLKLREHDVTLRVRRDGARRLQTIKLGLDSSAAPLARSEWEAEIKSTQPDLTLAKGTPLAPLIAGKGKGGLRPMFRTDVRRSATNLRVNGSEIELAVDVGKIVAGRRAQPICELELELKKGRLHDLALLTARLSRALPVSLGAQPKSDRGYALKLGEERKAVRAKDITLNASWSAGAAFTQIGLSCLYHLAANQDAVDAGDGEGIHQMRVGLRRLRAAISLFGSMLAGKETEHIKTELRWLTEQLGPARDLDVLAKEAVAPLRAANPDQPEIAVLERDVQRERDHDVEGARAAVRSKRCRKAVLATALWLIDGRWSRAAAPDRGRSRAVVAVATDILDRRTKKVIKRARNLRSLDARDRHRLRIAIKKLRYATEFFSSLFHHPKRQKRFRETLTNLQDCLGALNDMTVHASRAHRLSHPQRRAPQQAEKAYAMGFLTGREKARAPALERAAEKAGKKLATTHRFW
jgi:inorganic triphosphatase YgiF